jgi:NCS1 family nucleobase:cation symporter-1
LTRIAGFFISAVVFYLLNLVFPVENMDQVDSVDVYGTFTGAEARRAGIAPLQAVHSVEKPGGRHSGEKEVALHGEKEV